MNWKEVHPLAALCVIVILSLASAVVLFGILSSTGILANQYVEFGGAAAGFFAAWWALSRWYASMEKERSTQKGETKLTQTQRSLEDAEAGRDELKKQVRDLVKQVDNLNERSRTLQAEFESLQTQRRELGSFIANLLAKDIVREAHQDSNSLTTLYQDTKGSLLSVFWRAQGTALLEELERDFEAAVLNEVRNSSGLRSWKAPTVPPSLAEEL